MTDLTTSYLGLQLRNPVVASASPLSQTVAGIRSLADGGVGAVVMYSLFEEQLRRESERIAVLEAAHEDSYAEATSFFPPVPQAVEDDPASGYLKVLETAAEVVDIPIIASMNGTSLGSWTDTARRFADAGASAVELNIYLVPGNIELSGEEVERRHLEIVQAVR
ncbi:MAG: dihydroorotate dehydrogenase-like protein, partial [Arachnia sp.]